MPTFVCPCGQRFVGEGPAGTVVVCSTCGRRSKIPGAVPAPQPAPLPFDLLDELTAAQQAPPATSSTSRRSSKQRSGIAPVRAGHSSGFAIEWNRFIPAMGGLLLLLVVGGTLIYNGPAWWEEVTASLDKPAAPAAASSVAHDQPVQPSWQDAYFNDKVYTLPPDAVDQPVAPQVLAGMRREAGAHPVEQGMELRIDVSKSFPSPDPLVYSLAESAPAGATIDAQSGLIQWTAPLDFPPGLQELLVHRTFEDMRADGGILFKVQILPSQGPPPRVGQLAPDAPLQTETRRKPLNFRGSIVYPLADYSLTAVVLSSKFYTTGEEAFVSPLDLALGWGCMSDESLLRRVEVSQADRRYSYSISNIVDENVDEMSRSSANVHIIPATKATADLLASVQRGDVVRLSGALVEVKRQFWKWRSSLIRDDRGDGACEVMWVDRAEIVTE